MANRTKAQLTLYSGIHELDPEKKQLAKDTAGKGYCWRRYCEDVEHHEVATKPLHEHEAQDWHRYHNDHKQRETKRR